MTGIEWAWLGVVLASAAAWTWIGARGAWMDRHIPVLSEVAPEMPAGRPWPKVSVIVPSRDEEKSVEPAARSLLAQDYPDLEVIAIDDRSGDATGRLLDGIAAEDPRLSAVHVAELPSGWLGKNHANHQGAARAAGGWLLFTDGDVMFDPSALRRAIAYAEGHGLGHLVVFPHCIADGFFERGYIASFAIILSLKFHSSGLRRAGSRAFAGVGAFNLVRAEEHRRVGGHSKLAMEVADDAKLGLILRRSGVRQGAILSGGLVSVRWQTGFFASLRGLLKNAFAGTEFRWTMVFGGTFFLALIGLVPLAALALSPLPAARFLALVPAAIGAITNGIGARRTSGGSGIEGLVFPFSFLCLIGVLFTSAALATLRGGIVWRGTLYPLDELRKGCVRERDWPASGAVGWE